ncbi:MAG: TetR/AcrR family transcriptional regulator [Polyangiaceae bacterium]|nr:TetR/AcrR family transcriptional regulator [Polyangiaceae bacterium]
MEKTPSEAKDTEHAPRAVDWENPRVASILAAAAKCFAENGFSATTLAEIGKELGLRKSIVHYYFASKGALIHEVQSYAYHRYLDQVRASLGAAEGSQTKRALSAMRSLRETIRKNPAATALNIEVWSASRRDPELKRRSAGLQKDARKLIGEGIAEVLGADASKIPQLEGLTTLLLAVLNGLAIAEYVEGDDAKTNEAFEVFLFVVRAGLKAVLSGGE